MELTFVVLKLAEHTSPEEDVVVALNIGYDSFLLLASRAQTIGCLPVMAVVV